MTDEERNRLQKELMKLADMMETCDPGDAEYIEYSREYKKIAKVLFPNMYKKKKRKPSHALIQTLTKCKCGQEGWQLSRNNQTEKVTIFCETCKRTSGACDTNSEARDKWNDTFTHLKITGSEVTFLKIVKEEELEAVAKEIYKEHPGEDGYYNFTKFLWVEYPDGKEIRLDEAVPYE